MSTNNHNTDGSSDAVVQESSNANHEMTLLMLQWRTLQQTSRRLATAASSATSTSPVEPLSESSSQDIGSSIPLSLQRRRQYREQGGTGTFHRPRLLRSDLVKLMDEALKISTEITKVVPRESTSSAMVTDTNGKY